VTPIIATLAVLSRGFTPHVSFEYFSVARAAVSDELSGERARNLLSCSRIVQLLVTHKLMAVLSSTLVHRHVMFATDKQDDLAASPTIHKAYFD